MLTIHFEPLINDHIRILLFRECEQRGRRLLFDSVSNAKSSYKCEDAVNVNASANQTESNKKLETESTDGASHEQFVQLSSEDVGLLSEMVFGTVAMTYKGPSFKIHSIESPPCIMCTKVFPDSEHTNCKQRDKVSDDTLGRLNSSSGSVTQSSRPSSGYLSGNSLSPENVKNSVCSNASSGCIVDISPPSGSNQSFDKSSSSSIGSSISNIRRRWLRAVSTSFSFSDTDNLFGYYGDNIVPGKENRRHKTRLGLTLLIRLRPGAEKMMESKLLEHAALLEGMLDRLRYCCIEPTRKSNGGLIERLQKATSCCTAWLLYLFKNNNDSPLLLWHDVLLHSIISGQPASVKLNQHLEQMGRLLDKIDTKTTNFFLSTFITGILTHHLGWVRTVASGDNHKLIDEWEQWYPYNPLWAQLGDLHGALGSPLRIVQTVIAGVSAKRSLINSVLSFASYFLRSGIVEKKCDERYSLEKDVERSIATLRSVENKLCSFVDVQKVPNPLDDVGEDRELDVGESFKNESTENKVSTTTSSKLKRTGTFQKEMNIYGLTQNVSFQQSGLMHCADNAASDGLLNDGSNDESDYPLSSVQIVISAFASKNETDASKLMRLDQRRTSSLGNFGHFETLKTEEAFQNDGTICSYGNFVNNRHKAFHSSEDLNSERRRSVYFTLGDEDVSYGRKQRNICQCASALPSLSKSPQNQRRLFMPSQSSQSMTICEICRNIKIKTDIVVDDLKIIAQSETKEDQELQSQNSELKVDEEVTLEDLLQQNWVIELPMPQSNKTVLDPANTKTEPTGFTKSLLSTKIPATEMLNLTSYFGYVWGMIMQGLIKNDTIDKRRKCDTEEELKKVADWWWPIQEEINILAKFPILDQTVDEAVCILADLDSWQVGLLSNKLHKRDLPLPIGMSRLVSNMLEGFLYIWKKYKSPEHCIVLLETRLREMWLRSEVLAQMLMVANVGDVSIDNITSALDVDAADLPLLLAVATTHTPEIAQRFGLSFA